MHQSSGIKMIIFVVSLGLTAQFVSAETTTLDQYRYQQLLAQLRCPKCQNESLYSSQVPLAIELRNIVKQMMLQDKTDLEIKQYLVERYGEFILYQPKFKVQHLLLWGLPLAILMLFTFLFIYHYHRREQG